MVVGKSFRSERLVATVSTNAMKLSSVLGKVREKHRHGLMAHWAFDRLTDVLARLGITVQVTEIYREGDTAVAEPQPLLTDLTWGLATIGELSELAHVRGDAGSHAEFLQRFQRGAQCYYLRHQGRAVGFSWCEINGASRPRFGLNFGPTDAYLYDAYSDTSYRGMNLVPYLRYQVLQDLKRRGCENVLSSTDLFNRAAHRFKRKLGAYPLSIRLYLGLWGRFGRAFTVYRFKSPAPSS